MGKTYKVIFVFSIPEEEFDPAPHRSFFMLDHGNVDLHSVEEFAHYVQADLNHLCFRDRLLPTEKKLVTIPIGQKSESHQLQVYDPEIAENTVRIPDTRPDNKDYEGIIVDLNLCWKSDRKNEQKEYQPYGLGIVAWAVMHGIPVGLVYKDDGDPDAKQKNFWIESVLDTLSTHSMCQGNKIPSGNICEVCIEMRKLIEEL
jgi:hypothetical protein